MKVSSKGHYGLLALAELADNYRQRRAVQVKEIAGSQQIPLQYLGQIMVLLKRGHLVNAARGPSGGYVLARPPETISVRQRRSRSRKYLPYWKVPTAASK
jgi:Rrf2 family protein